MSEYYDGRYCHPLVLYDDGEYRVVRTKFADIEVQRKRESKWDDEVILWWDDIKNWSPRLAWVMARGRKAKLAFNQLWAKRGKEWIERYKLLLAGPMWEVRCGDWDGQGTPCPIQHLGGCPIRFGFLSYSGNPFNCKDLPGRCDGPLNSSHSLNLCVPGTEDRYDFTMSHFMRIRHEIWERLAPKEEP